MLFLDDLPEVADVDLGVIRGGGVMCSVESCGVVEKVVLWNRSFSEPRWYVGSGERIDLHAQADFDIAMGGVELRVTRLRCW